MLTWLKEKVGLRRKRKNMGLAISMSAQADLDFIYKMTGFHAHHISRAHRFNGHIQSAGNAQAQRIESLIREYSYNGYIFTNGLTLVIGNVCSFDTKEKRVAERRSRITMVSDSDKA